MAYAPHLLVQIAGDIVSEGDPVEIWSMGFRCIATADAAPSTPLTATVADQEDYADYLETNWVNTLHNNGFIQVAGQTVKIKTLKVNAIGADGKYVNDVTTVRDLSLDFGGSTVTLSYPLQVSKVLTLETGKTRGLGHRGRVYVPGPKNVMSTPGLFSIATQERTAWATFVGLLRYSTGAGAFNVDPAVVSGSGDPSSNWNRITGISMDNRFDVQRRRANDIQGVRVADPLP